MSSAERVCCAGFLAAEALRFELPAAEGRGLDDDELLASAGGSSTSSAAASVWWISCELLHL